MELRQLSYFKTIAETENVSKASRLLHVAQPFLSRTIRELEAELDLTLFSRTGRSIRLNSNGEILLHYAGEMLRLQEQALAELKKNRRNQQASLNIVMLNSTRIFPKLIANFSDCHPDIKFSLIKFSSVTEIPASCDVIIHASEQLARKMKTIVLFQEECLLGMSLNHPLANKPEILPDMLANETFLLLPQDNMLGSLTRQYLVLLNITPKVPLQCDNQQTLTALVEEGMGLAFFPAKTWKIESEEIHLRKIAVQPLQRNIFLSVASKDPSEFVKTFCDFIVNACSDYT